MKHLLSLALLINMTAYNSCINRFASYFHESESGKLHTLCVEMSKLEDK